MRMVAIIVLALLVVSPGVTGAGLTPWPVDLDLAREAAVFASESRIPMTTEEFIETAAEAELSFVLSRDLIVVGTATSMQCYSQGTEIYTATTVEVEECVKGDYGSGVLTMTTFGGTVGDRTLAIQGSGPPWAGPFNTDPPDPGDRCVFLLRYDEDDPSSLRSGGPRWRYQIKDGQVVRKGVPLDDFLVMLRGHLALRTPEALFGASDAVVLGVVKEVVSSRKIPPVSGDTPEARNFVLLDIQEVGKGDVIPGGTVRVELPYTADRGHDSPRFQQGERSLVFLEMTTEGIWVLAGGWDSKARVLDDGAIEGVGTLADLLSRAEGQ